MAQLDDVHSVLRPSCETLKGLISLASQGVAKLTLCETRQESYRTRASKWKTAPNEELVSLALIPGRLLHVIDDVIFDWSPLRLQL